MKETADAGFSWVGVSCFGACQLEEESCAAMGGEMPFGVFEKPEDDECDEGGGQREGELASSTRARGR